jgi:hypothetical protein
MVFWLIFVAPAKNFTPLSNTDAHARFRLVEMGNVGLPRGGMGFIPGAISSTR